MKQIVPPVVSDVPSVPVVLDKKVVTDDRPASPGPVRYAPSSRVQPVVEVVAPESKDPVAIGMYDKEVSGGDAVVPIQADDI